MRRLGLGLATCLASSLAAGAESPGPAAAAPVVLGLDHVPVAVANLEEAAERYRAEGVPLIVIAGLDYGAGSSRDWAAKGTRLLGVRAVIAGGFERIHRSNLIGMGVFPCQLPEGVSAQRLGLDGTERFDLELGAPLRPRQPANLHIERRDGRSESVPVVLRIDTPIEAAYFSAGGILPYVLEQLLAHA